MPVFVRPFRAQSRLPRSFVPFTFRRLCWSVQAALLGTLAAPLHADELVADELQLTPLVITSVAPESPLTVVTDPRQPRQPVPASDAADYLKTIPGFAAARSGGVNGDPVFRGLFGSRLKLLTNGGEMLGACPGRMDAPSSYISPESYDRLTVIKGPQTVRWGPGASAATVLFEREPERFEKPDWRLDARLLGGSNGRFDRALDAAAGSQEGYVRLLANRSQSDDYQDGDGDRVPSRFDKWNTDVVLGWTPDADTLLELSAGGGDGEARYAGRGMDGAQFKRESLGLRLVKSHLGDVLDEIEAQVYYNYADHVMDNYSLRTPSGHGMMGMPMAHAVDRRTLGGRLSATWRWDGVELVGGVDAQRNEHRGRMGMGIDTYRDQPWEKDAALHNYGAFGELTWFVAEQGRLIGGLRLDRASAKDYRQRIGSGANPSAGDTRNDTLSSGFVRYEHDLADSPTTLYAGLGHAQRFPDYWELFSPTNGPADTANAFVGVDPEKTTQLDVGAQFQGEKLDAWVSAYAGEVRDYILFDYSEGRSRARNVTARIAGAELGAGYPLAENWKGEASLAYAWGENRTDRRALPQIPPLEARFGLTYERGDWSAAGLWRLVAAQGRIAEGQGNVVGKDFGESAGFGVLSFNGAYRLSANLKVSAGVDNLLDKAYAEHLNLAGNAGFGFAAGERVAEPGRTFWTRLDLSF
ncbi:TonB-dependent copper receptor [Zestomonas carbonaria]|uniref:Vitamin B12 transporter BtuB n=1 Tax=Zestomonas carbonaria TaxID=2762745 RepID=A0A7U7I9C0_9GAMM|nr:TonB-dependent copper receptor [Pseudomonas carbonaria]CAD5108056.1 Vitamin B12 transporter BtuB [Pseudomonas carbonaria]